MKTIQTDSYPIYFKNDGYTAIDKIIKTNSYSTIFILVDENSLEHCYPLFLEKISCKTTFELLKIKSGEEYKNITTCVDVWNNLTNLKGDRKSLLITLGGGVITDLGGFVASTFKRGIDFINIPTTLLSMVDASVGGKTGVDLGGLKNQIGLFSNPELVLIDPLFLDTLAEKEFKSGIAEILKYGLTHDFSLYKKALHHQKESIEKIIHQSVCIKNEVVKKDPKENGIRKILNFGHTIGHAIESYFLTSTEREKLTHGEAIAIGMICASFISSKKLSFPMNQTINIKKEIINFYGKVDIQLSEFPPIMDLLKHDKKNSNGNVNFVLLNNLENFQLDCTIGNQLIEESLLFYIN